MRIFHPQKKRKREDILQSKGVLIYMTKQLDKSEGRLKRKKSDSSKTPKSEKPKGKWLQVGELRKTKRPDLLRGTIYLPDLNMKLEVIALLKTSLQKRNAGDPDVVILHVDSASKKGTEDLPQIF